jgi:hypothetical protein
MKVESKKIRAAARGQDCTVRLPGICNFNPETTVLAHLPCGQRGIGIKSPDNIAVFSCSACHDAIDGRVRVGIDWKDMLRALAKTQLILIEKGIMVIK